MTSGGPSSSAVWDAVSTAGLESSTGRHLDLSSPESSRDLIYQICLWRLTVYSALLSWGFRDEWEEAQAWAVKTKVIEGR